MAIDNPVLKDMTPEEIEEFRKKCVASKAYFWNNYIRKLPGQEHLPEYSDEQFERWTKMAKEARIKRRR